MLIPTYISTWNLIIHGCYYAANSNKIYTSLARSSNIESSSMTEVVVFNPDSFLWRPKKDLVDYVNLGGAFISLALPSTMKNGDLTHKNWIYWVCYGIFMAYA